MIKIQTKVGTVDMESRGGSEWKKKMESLFGSLPKNKFMNEKDTAKYDTGKVAVPKA